MKKWPSGRRRQTVNLLVNSSRWFESNFFQMKKTHPFLKKLHISNSKLISKTVRRSLRNVRKGTFALTDPAWLPSQHSGGISVHHISPYINSRSRRLIIDSLLPLVNSRQAAVVFRSSIGRGAYMLLPNSRHGSFITNRRRRSTRFFISLSNKMRLTSPRNNLRSFIRSSLVVHKAVRRPRPFTLNPTEWQSILETEQQFLYDLRSTRRLKRHNRIKKSPSFNLTNLVRLPLVSESRGNLTPPKFSKNIFSANVCASSVISKGYVIKYLERSYIGIKDSLSRLIKSWVSQYRLLCLSSESFLLSYTSVPGLSHILYPAWLSAWTSLTGLYSSFTLFPQTDLYYKIHSAQRKVIEHILRFRFNNSRLHIVLEDSKVHQTHFFTTPGLFIRYFQGKKSLKKSKALKYLMARFLRKMLLVLNLESVGVITKGVPVNLDQLLTAIFKPLSHPFTNPLNGEIINESDSTTRQKPKRGNVGISSITFLAPKPFSYQKTRKRGRIKRKIQRKLVRLNKVID